MRPVSKSVIFTRLKSSSNPHDLFNLEIDINEEIETINKTHETTESPEGEKESMSTWKDPSRSAESFEDGEDDPSELDEIFDDLFREEDSLKTDDVAFEDSLAELLNSVPAKPQASPQIKPKQENADEARILEAEKDLFDKIFEIYAKKDDVAASPDRLQSNVLSTLKESFSNRTPERAAAPLISHTEKLSYQELEKVLTQTKDALGPTLAYLRNLQTRSELLKFVDGVLKSFRECTLDESFYKRKLKNESSEDYVDRQAEENQDLLAKSKKTPNLPALNVFSMPILFNEALKLLLYKFNDGPLAVTLFNSVKEDLNAYTIICNQETYNEMLKVHWILYGKQSLCEVELIVVEMINNGFRGDQVTFSILKQILSTFQKMRLGSTRFNLGGMPIWSKKDVRRAKNIYERLKVLARELRGKNQGASGLFSQ